MIVTASIADEEVEKLLKLNEDHFRDLKAKEIPPSKLTRTLSAFANAEGGELYIGITDIKRTWDGFENEERANGFIQAFEELFPAGNDHKYTFLKNDKQNGVVLKIEIDKSRDIKKASDGIVYLRRSAQNLPIKDASALERLKKNKGISSYESETIKAEPEVITNSSHIINFMLEVIPTSEPEIWLKKQRLLLNNLPTAAGVLLFAEEPQALMPKQCGLKIYQYGTKGEGERETLAFDPITIEGNCYEVIKNAVSKTQELIELIRIMTPKGLKKAQYPSEALHEIVTNAVLHRDYSLMDDIHIRIYDNRVEIQSPGSLPAHITPQNILDERFARNGVIVRLINKFPNAPNKDVGEGLNTAFQAMKKMKLKDPIIEQKGMNVLITLRHESLGTPEELILTFLDKNPTITNKQAREICATHSENTMKHTLKRMVKADMIDIIKGKTVFDTSYKKKAAN